MDELKTCVKWIPVDTKLLAELKELAIREHYYCEDEWYSCPLADDGCLNDDVDPNECDCGADEHNAKVEDIYKKLVGE